MEHIDVLLKFPAGAANSAALACRDWKNGGDPGPVADTAWEAEEAISMAIGGTAAIRSVFERQELGSLPSGQF